MYNCYFGKKCVKEIAKLGKFRQNSDKFWPKSNEFLTILAKFGNNLAKFRNVSAMFRQKIKLWERCKGVHCVDFSESFPTHIFLQDTADNEHLTRTI